MDIPLGAMGAPFANFTEVAAFYASIFGTTGLILSLVSMALKNDRHLLWVSALAGIFWGLNGFALGSTAAFWTQMVGSAAVFARLVLPSPNLKVLGFLAISLTSAAGLASWEGFISLPVILATAFLLYGTTVASGMSIRVALLCSNTFFLAHAYLYGASEQMVACGLGYVSLFFGFRKLLKAAREEQATFRSYPTLKESLRADRG